MHRSTWRIVVGLVAVTLVAVGVWWWSRPRAVPPDQDVPDQPTTAELREFVDESRRAVAHLENEHFDDAIPLLESLRERVPEDPFAVRNLAIARLLQLESRPANFDAVAAETREDVATLGQLDDGPLPARLSARLALANGDSAAATEALDAAIALDADDASLRFELWLALRDDTNEPQRSRAVDALFATHEMAPGNVFVLCDLLSALAADEDARLPGVIDDATATLRPFAPGIQKRTTANVVELLDQAAASVAKGEWKAAQRTLRIVANVVRPEAVAQSDRLLVDRNLLEFVALDFRPEFYEQTNWRPPETPPPVPVTFRAVPLDVGEWPAVEALLLRDIDLDDEPDLVFLDGESLNVLLRRAGQFVPTVTIPASGFSGVLTADLDTDVPVERLSAVVPGDGVNAAEDATTAEPETCHVADLDFVLWGASGIRVVENRRDEDGAIRLVPVEDLGALADVRGVTSAVLADVDHEGDLDLVVGTLRGLEAFANRGDLVFERMLDPVGPTDATSLLPVDVDGDLDLDVIVTAGEGRGGWLENLRHGEFRWRPDETVPSDVAVEVVDDGSGSWSLVAIDDGRLATLGLSRSTAAALCGAQTEASESAADSGLVFDFDNDGQHDLLGFGPQGIQVIRRQASLAADATSLTKNGIAACDFADIDSDGDLDIVAVMTDGRMDSFVNDGGNENRWLRVALRAQQIRGEEQAASGRVNQYGFGSLLQPRIGAVDRRIVVRRPWTHIGLGKEEGASAVRVLWTNGIPFNVVAPSANQLVCERQVLKGSCPYLYTWNGERFAFVTDLLWGSPIGLQFADGVLAPARPWEHLRVPGEALVARDGRYELRITEELWEVGYFDYVSLEAIDHPVGTSVFTNEKVGGPDVAEPRLHTVTTPRTPVAIHDSERRDLLPTLRERDERYARAFRTKWRQGVVNEHFLEIDLGPAARDAENVTLFLTGWLQPSDTSLNVALSHDPRLPSPTPPSLQVVGADGEWETAIPFTGFPGGKTKTIALDLDDVFRSDDRRVRLVTSMEFYWDHVFYTVDEPDVPLKRTRLELDSADLHYRGFSRETLPSGLGPHHYDYDDVSSEPRWPAIRGRFTRYGDVQELLVDEDDRLVVLGAGDEMTLQFRVPETPPPAGWTRDFVLTNVGWDKDADLNTVLGQSVEPLPFGSMPRYPYGAFVEYPPEETLRRDRLRFHTRRQAWQWSTWRRPMGTP